MNEEERRVLVLGGAGFVGSVIAETCHLAGYAVAVFDGLLAGTGGRLEHVTNIPDVALIEGDVASYPKLPALLDAHDVIVDSMAWTSHHDAIVDPIRDLRINAESHLHVIQALARLSGKTVISLGSRSQYGNPPAAHVDEAVAMHPVDVQGIHKVAAESYYRVYAPRMGFAAVSLRFGNCFGEHQPVQGTDIGLVGGFIRDSVADRTITVYGHDRRRVLVYVRDVAQVVLALIRARPSGFAALNLGGHTVKISELAEMIVELVGGGECKVEPLPNDIRAMDSNIASMDESRLREVVGEISRTDLKTALGTTVNYFREQLS